MKSGEQERRVRGKVTRRCTQKRSGQCQVVAEEWTTSVELSIHKQSLLCYASRRIQQVVMVAGEIAWMIATSTGTCTVTKQQAIEHQVALYACEKRRRKPERAKENKGRC